MSEVIFITGTDTGVGKTVLTTLLLKHLRSAGVHALAMKPFCSGGRSDARILYEAQAREITLERVNPFYFSQAAAPLVGARRSGRLVALKEVTARIRELRRDCDVLLIEGAGGLSVPLGIGYTVADLIAALRCRVLLVVRNKLGAVNHTLLTLAALRRQRARKVTIVIMNPAGKDLAKRTNRKLIQEFAGPVPVFGLPYLGKKPLGLGVLKRNEKKLKKLLQQIYG